MAHTMAGTVLVEEAASATGAEATQGMDLVDTGTVLALGTGVMVDTPTVDMGTTSTRAVEITVGGPMVADTGTAAEATMAVGIMGTAIGDAAIIEAAIGAVPYLGLDSGMCHTCPDAMTHTDIPFPVTCIHRMLIEALIQSPDQRSSAGDAARLRVIRNGARRPDRYESRGGRGATRRTGRLQLREAERL
jgi:hypothetical protein